MTSLEWLVTISVSIVLLFSFFFLLFFYFFLRNKKQYSSLQKKRFKRQRAKKNKKRQLKLLLKSKKRFFYLTIFSIVIVIVSAGIAGYAKYYEMSNLSKNDMENIADGYYFISNVKTELENIKNKDISSPEKTSENLHSLSLRLSGFSAKKGSDRNSVEGQYLLNRYYSLLGQFGLNLSSQDYSSFIENETLLEGFLSDIDKIDEQQTKVIDFFKIDKSSLTIK